MRVRVSQDIVKFGGLSPSCDFNGHGMATTFGEVLVVVAAVELRRCRSRRSGSGGSSSSPKAQNSPKASYSMVFGPKSLEI